MMATATEHHRRNRKPPRQQQQNVTSEILDSLPPCNVEAEQCLLGCLLFDPLAIDRVADKLATNHFYVEANRVIYEHMLALRDEGTPIDAAILASQMRPSGALEAIGGAATIAEAAASVIHAEHLPYYVKEVREKAAMRQALEGAKSLLQECYRGGSALDVAHKLGGVIDRLTNEVDRPHFQGFSLAELAAEDTTTEFIIQDIFAAGHPGICGGPQKAMKTSIAADMALSISTGVPFLKTFPVLRAARVAYLCGEGGKADLKDKFLRVAASKDLRPQDVAGLTLCDQLPVLTDRTSLAALTSFLVDAEAEVVFIDPVYLCLDGADAGNVLVMGSRMAMINQACRKAGCTPVLVHHTKRGVADPYAPADLTALSWSGFAEFAGQWWLLSRRKPFIPGRDDHHELWLSVGGRAGHCGLWGLDVREGARDSEYGRYWHVDVMEPDKAQDAAERRKDEAKQSRVEWQCTADQSKILRTLAKIGGNGDTKSNVRDRANIPTSRFNAALAALLDDGKVIPSQIERTNGQKYDAIKLGDISDDL